MATTIQVEQGWLEGKECQSCFGQKYYSFEGIPYAKPPLGRLRFSNPQRPEKWDGIRSAKNPGNKCAQINPYIGAPLIGSEDCLYLNIYTPSLPSEKLEKLPVIFFIHGGRLIIGYGDYYSPDYLIKHNVILVTINYRLNMLGFLCLNIPEAPGNVGIKDAVYALRWVGRNISQFNGDSGNITVFGESAGAAFATSFLTSNMCRGSFSKVIAQSGNCLSDLFLIDHDPIEKARQLALVLGKDLEDEKTLYEFLVQVPYEDLVNALAPLELNRPPSIIESYFQPVIEKKFDNIECFFEEHPLESIKNNRVAKVPMITGYCTHESAAFTITDDPGEIVKENDLHYFIPRYLNVKWQTEKSRKIITKLKETYFSNGQSNLAYLDFISDAYYLRDIIRLAEFLDNDKLYLYQFGFVGNLNTRVMKNLGVKGTTHGDLIQYQFYRKSKAVKCKERDARMVEFLSECWSNFAKTGVPTWTNQKTKWLPYSRNRQKLVIDDPVRSTEEDNFNRIKVWLDLTKDKSKL